MQTSQRTGLQLLAVAAAAMFAGSTLGGTTYYVNATCGDDSWTGLSPTCQAPDGPKATIQAGIDTSADGDEVIVAAGTYREAIDFTGKAVRLTGAEGAATTIIDASGLLTSVVTCDSGEGPDTILEGFTLTGGAGTLVRPGERYGGGMYIVGSSPTVRDCIFLDNLAVAGGGGMYCLQAEPIIEDCSFIENSTATAGGGMLIDLSDASVVGCFFERNAAGLGGGIYTENSEPRIVDSTFKENTAEYAGGLRDGGGATVVRCDFIMNSADQMGGASNVQGVPPTTFKSCSFIGNSAGEQGGAIRSSATRLEVYGCLFVGNTSGRDGGGLFALASTPDVIACTFVENTNAGLTAGSATVVGCIVRDNVNGQILGQDLDVRFSNIEGGYPGKRNIDLDPRFVDPDGGDYRLAAGSPCIDAGDTEALPHDLYTDLDGNLRRIDDPDTPDTGHGEPPIVDMGVYEYQTIPYIRLPRSLVVVRGDHEAGGIEQLYLSDDDRVRIRERYRPDLPIVRMEAYGVSNVDEPTGLSVVIETGTNALPTQSRQELSLLDYDAKTWEVIDSRIVTLTDTVLEVAVGGDPRRFVEEGTNTMIVRIDWFDPGEVFFPAWNVRVDQAIWKVTP